MFTFKMQCTLHFTFFFVLMLFKEIQKKKLEYLNGRHIDKYIEVVNTYELSTHIRNEYAVKFNLN